MTAPSEPLCADQMLHAFAVNTLALDAVVVELTQAERAVVGRM